MDAIRATISEDFGGLAQKAAKPEHQFSLEDVPDLTDKVAVITGASDGIGYAATHTMLSRNIEHIHMLSSSEYKADEAQKQMGELAQRVTWHQVDLDDWQRVKTVAQKIAEKTDRIDILVNNAARGIMTYQKVEDKNLDRHMAVNHFGHVVLTSELLPVLKKTAAKGFTVRIVNQASNAHQFPSASDVKFESAEDLNRDLGPNAQYGRSKLAVILYSRYLANHLSVDHPNVLVNATHPGFVRTTMSTQDIHEPYPILGYAMSVLMKPLQKDQWEGALSLLYTATATDKTGEYVCPPATPEPGSPQAQDKALGEQLMKLTQQIYKDRTGETLQLY